MKKLVLATIALGSAANPAFAHLNPAEHGSFAAGLSHPVFGLDHILAMVAVGLWAALLGQRALWVLPLTFVGTMVVGFVYGVAGFSLPFVEPMILVSVFGLGLAVALSLRAPVPVAASIVGAFALFHGYAHGSELGAATALSFGAGFALATALLHGAGVAIALAATRLLAGSKLVQGLGWATILGGVWVAAAG